MADGNGLELDSNGVGGKMLLNGREVSIEGFFPYKGDFGRSTLVVSADGVCDPLMQNVRERLAYTRHALFVLRGTVANLGDPIVFAPQSIVVGNAGPENDAGPLGYGPLSGPLTRAETNAQKDGGLVQQGQSFVTVGMSVAAGAPWFVTPGEGSTAANCSLLDNRHFPKWLRDPGTGYASAAIQALNETTVLEKWKIGPTTACEYDLMPLSMQNASRYSETQATGIPGYFWNFAVPAVTGGRQSGRELNFGINNLRTCYIDSDGGNPTQAGAVAVPFRVSLVGFPICDTATGGVSQDAIAAMVQAQVQAQVAAMLGGKGAGGYR